MRDNINFKANFLTSVILVILFYLSYAKFTSAQSPSAQPTLTAQQQKLVDDLPTLGKTPEGFIPWKRFQKRDKELKKLAGTSVKVQGFMFPLDQSEKQEHFLLSVYPPSCPFCYPAGPDGLIEVFMDKGIEFSEEPVKIEGVIEFPELSDAGLLYRMKSVKKL